MGEIIKFNINNLELDEKKIFIKNTKDILVKEGAPEHIAEKLANTVYMVVDKNLSYAMEQSVLEFLNAINEQTDEEFEEFVQGLRLGRQESREGIE